MNTTAIIPVDTETRIRNALSDAHAAPTDDVEPVSDSIPRLHGATLTVNIEREEGEDDSEYALRVTAELSLPAGTPAEGIVSTPPQRLSMYGSDFERFRQEFERLLDATTAYDAGRPRFTLDGADGETATYSVSTRVEHAV